MWRTTYIYGSDAGRRPAERGHGGAFRNRGKPHF